MTFSDVLARLERELDIPYPERRQVLDEIRSHLEDRYAELTTGGVAAEEAARRAIDELTADRELIASMTEVHATRVARALAKLPRKVAMGLEYGLISITGVLLLLAVFHKEVAMLEFFLEGGFFMIALNVAGLAILFLIAERIYSLFVKRDHSADNLPRRLLSLRFLGVATALAGLLGTLVGLYHAFSVAEELPDPFPILDVVKIAITTTIWGLTLSLIALVGHFVIRAKVARIEAMQLPAA